MDGVVLSTTGESSICELSDVVEWESISVLIRSNRDNIGFCAHNVSGIPVYKRCS